VDFSRLPLGPVVEDVVLMAGIRSPLIACFSEEGFSLEVDWSRDHLPHCMMWVHDRGLDTPPWGGGYRGVGLEPLASAFDGPWLLSAGANPLERRGYRTCLALEPGSPMLLHLDMAVSSDT
jgi:hypothetical protein